MKYAVYLTKNHEVAETIAKAFKVGEDDVHSIASGSTKGVAEIPPMYQSENTFCCVVIYYGKADIPPYRLIIA